MEKRIKQVIRCGTCEKNGIKQNLAEVLPSGMISVQRIRKGSFTGDYKDFTLIGGDKMFIVCGKCGSIVYKRKK